MTTLSIDIETFSCTDLKKCGVYRYAADPDFEVMLLAYRYNNGPVNLLDLTAFDEFDPASGAVPYQLIDDLRNPEILKRAYNAMFEITALCVCLGIELDPAQWSCTMAKAAMLGLPFGLGEVARVLRLTQQKDYRGANLIRHFCVPCKPSAANGNRVRNMPYHSPEKWEEFKEYCKADVLTECAIADKIAFFEPCQFEREVYALDQRINARGVMIDRRLVNQAIGMNEVFKERMATELFSLTGIRKATEVKKLKDWLSLEIDEDVTELNKDSIPGLIKSTDDQTVKRVLEIRQMSSKSSVSKFAAMLNWADTDDDRIRGLFQYYGANRTGRFAGRGVQMQNLTKNYIKDIGLARELVRAGDMDTVEMCFGRITSVLSQLVRPAFIPRPGYIFLVSDFSAIEARVLAWLAGETWVLDVFTGHGKIYEEMAGRMFRVPMESIKKGSTERDAGKVAVLALGYQGAEGAITQMIISEKRKALEQGKKWTYDPPEAEKGRVKDLYRSANPNIVQFWWDLNNAVIECVEDKRPVTVGYVTYYMEKGILFCRLPSGRVLSYMRPIIEMNKFNRKCVSYEGMNQTSKKWERTQLYGGLLAENITQAVARDLLVEKMKLLDLLGYSIVAHVHDEVIIESHVDLTELESINDYMGVPVSWAPGLPLKGDSFETYYYKKED